MIFFFKSRIYIYPRSVGEFIAIFHQPPVRCDIKTPYSKLLNLALLFAYNNSHLCLSHPDKLINKIILFFSRSHFLGIFYLFLFLLPILLDQFIHPYTSELVNAHKHRFTGFPSCGVVLDKILGDLTEPLFRRDDVIVSLEFFFKPLTYINIINLYLLQLLSNPFVDIFGGYTQGLAPAVIIERDRRFILYRPLKVISGNVISKNPGCDFLIL